MTQRLDALSLAPEARQQLDAARAQRAALELPPQTAAQVRRAIAEAFITGFRRVLMLAVALAVLGELLVWLVVEKPPHSQASLAPELAQ